MIFVSVSGMKYSNLSVYLPVLYLTSCVQRIHHKLWSKSISVFLYFHNHSYPNVFSNIVFTCISIYLFIHYCLLIGRSHPGRYTNHRHTCPLHPGTPFINARHTCLLSQDKQAGVFLPLSSSPPSLYLPRLFKLFASSLFPLPVPRICLHYCIKQEK